MGIFFVNSSMQAKQYKWLMQMKYTLDHEFFSNSHGLDFRRDITFLFTLF